MVGVLLPLKDPENGPQPSECFFFEKGSRQRSRRESAAKLIAIMSCVFYVLMILKQQREIWVSQWNLDWYFQQVDSQW